MTGNIAEMYRFLIRFLRRRVRATPSPPTETGPDDILWLEVTGPHDVDVPGWEKHDDWIEDGVRHQTFRRKASGEAAESTDDEPPREDGAYDPRPDPRTHPEFWTE